MATDVTAPMVGKILKIEAAPGSKLNEDDTVVVMEAMKMEIPVVAPASGTVREIRVSVGEMVDSDQVIAVIE